MIRSFLLVVEWLFFAQVTHPPELRYFNVSPQNWQAFPCFILSELSEAILQSNRVVVGDD